MDNNKFTEEDNLNDNQSRQESHNYEEETKAKKFKPKRRHIVFGGLILIAFIFALVIYVPGFISRDNETSQNPSGQANGGKRDGKNEIAPIAVSAIGDITITPTKSSKSGVEVDTDFIIKTKEPMSKEHLLESLSVKSGETFNIEKFDSSADNEFVLSFNSPLENDKIYNIEYKAADKHPLSFAFQTVSTFHVVATLPSDDGYSVPVNSGIEITFSDEAAGEFEDYFKIEPHVAGRFDRVGNTYIFIPEKLNYDTQYDVTIKNDIKNKSGESIGKDYEFSFRTKWEQNSENYCSISGDVYETFLPDDDVFIELIVADEFRDKDYTVEIYDLITPDSYISCYDKSNRTVSIPASAKLSETIQTKLFVAYGAGQYNSDVYSIMLHKPLKDGYYLIKIKTEHNNKEVSATKLIQVSALSVYSASLDGESCFWVNDTITQLSASGAKINIDGTTGVTDGDGKAIIKTVANRFSIVKIDYADYPTYIYANRTFDPMELSTEQKYYTYMYTDRPYYKSNDTIDVFGVIKPKNEQFRLGGGDKITLQFGDMLEIPLNLDEYGSFNVRLPVKNMYGDARIGIYLNDELVLRRYVEFMDYPRDKYVISAQSDRYAYFAGEKADVDLFVTTYDNSPIEGVELKNNNVNSANLLTKSDGTVSTAMIINSYQGSESWYPRSDYLRFSVVGSEDHSQSVYVPIYVLPSGVMLEDKKISKNSIEFTSSLIDRDAIERYMQKNEMYYSVEADIYRGKPIDIDFTIDIYKRTTTRVKTSDRYDFIQKINIPQYDYNTEEEFFSTLTAKTVNGKATVKDLPTSEDNFISYYGVVRFKDKSGKSFSQKIYFGTEYSNRNQSPTKEYYFRLARESVDDETWNSSLKLNETGTIKLYEYNGDTSENITSGKILIIPSNEKIISAAVGNPSGSPITFTEECINNIYVYGAYFDGKYIYPIEYPLVISFDTSERKLSFDMTYDKEVYRPGDEVTATVKVTDEDGKPKKSLVNISVVDEAVLNNRSEPDFLNSYYNSIYLYGKSSFIYSSYTQHALGYGYGGAEEGGGGDNFEIRKDFRDNPAFASVETNSDGVATISFKLADAVTSWRVTAHAITKDDFAGSTKTNVIATMPYYIDMVMSDEFVVGDEVSVLVKSLGTAYKLNKTDVKYTIEVFKGSEIIYTETKPSTSYVSFNAGKLAEGEYTVRIKSVAGEYKDAMEEKISVVKTGIRLPLWTKQLLTSDNPTLSAYDIAGSPVRVTMSNGDISFLTDILYSCMNYGSERTDYKASTAFADFFLDGLYGREQTMPAYAYELKNSLQQYGGIPELPYGAPEPFYTARFAACFPELINKSELTAYIIDNTGMYKNAPMGQRGIVTEESTSAEAEAERAAGYLALAAAGENVLLEIYGQIDVIKNSSNQEKFKNDYYEHLRILYYAAALCAIGDDSGASELINTYKADANMLSSTGDSKEKQLRSEHINTLTLFVNSTINPPQAYEYLKTKKNNLYVSDVCEKTNFIKKVVPISGTTSEVQYTLNGETKTAQFNNFDRMSLSITKEQFEDLNLKQVSGNTAVRISFYGAAENLNASYDKIDINKQVLGGAKGSYKITFDVKMPSDAKSGYYTIRDRVPSNMRFTQSVASETRQNYYVDNPEKQSVNISFYYNGENRNISVMYNAIKVNDAEAVAGPAYVSENFSLDELWGGSK